jgi:hypothetical protein
VADKQPPESDLYGKDRYGASADNFDITRPDEQRLSFGVIRYTPGLTSVPDSDDGMPGNQL